MTKTIKEEEEYEEEVTIKKPNNNIKSQVGQSQTSQRSQGSKKANDMVGQKSIAYYFIFVCIINIIFFGAN